MLPCVPEWASGPAFRLMLLPGLPVVVLVDPGEPSAIRAGLGLLRSLWRERALSWSCLLPVPSRPGFFWPAPVSAVSTGFPFVLRALRRGGRAFFSWRSPPCLGGAAQGGLEKDPKKAAAWGLCCIALRWIVCANAAPFAWDDLLCWSALALCRVWFWPARLLSCAPLCGPLTVVRRSR
jgi:hypothetical protein